MCTEVWHNPSSLRRGREPPGRHLSSTRTQRRNATEVDCVRWPLYLVLRPSSQTVAGATVMLLVVASRVQLARERSCAGRFRAPRHEPQAIRRVRGLTAYPKAFAVVASPEAVPSARSEERRVCAAAGAMSAVVRRSET